MANSVFYPLNQAFGWLMGGLRNAVLGRGGGKFPNAVNYQPMNQRVILMDTDSPGALMQIAMQVPHLNTIITTGAELFSLMEIKHFNKNKEEIPFEQSKVLQFLRQPNPLQIQEQYLHEFYVMNGVYNKTFQYKIQALSFDKIPKAMWLLPSGWMKINATGKLYRQTDINEIIEGYEMLDSTNSTFEVDKVIYMSEGIGNNVLDPISKIHANIIPLSNIVASLKSRNIIVTERGTIGMLSPEGFNKDSDGILPNDSEEAKRIRQEYQNQYHLDSRGGHVMVSQTPLKWTPLTYDINQLGLAEGMEEDFATLVNAFRHDRDIYSSVKGATFENKAAGLRATIQNGMQPLADKLMRQLTKHLIEEGTGEYLEANYNYLPYMQADELKKSTSNQIEGLRLSKLYQDGVITIEQYAQMAMVDYEEPKPEQINIEQRNLRGLVGGINGIIQVNQFVAQGFIDKPAAIAIIMSVYGYDQAAASSMITSLTVDISTPAPASITSNNE